MLRKIRIFVWGIVAELEYILYPWKHDNPAPSETIVKYNLPEQDFDKNLIDGKTYQYYLTAYDENSETGPSNVVKAKTKDLPSFPDGITAKSNLVKSIWISWTPINDPDVGGYILYRGNYAKNMEFVFHSIHSHGTNIIF